ncbi:hypothetical protein V7R84_02835 [Arachnia propionica]|uniref:hypothetical protein n=1 Tax=Arachnia propionica TaxID=1750 RepID=UPI0030D0565E
MSAPRLVVVHRRTWLAELLEVHSTLGAVEFFLSGRGLGIEALRAADEAQWRTLDAVSNAVPAQWRHAEVERGQLSRFLFEPDDLVVVVGQDGLIPNVSKYLRDQPVLGIGPGAPGVLCRHSPGDLRDLLAGRTRPETEVRTMVEAIVDDGQRLRALNEIFAGDRGHQSARYDLRIGKHVETQSSSGVVVGTGTGAGGWLASLWGQSHPGFGLPGATSGELAYFVREAWPSDVTGTSLTAGLLAEGEGLELSARSALVVFGDGIERDFLRLEWGQALTVRKAEGGLKLMCLK